jgi:hypothetical protein
MADLEKRTRREFLCRDDLWDLFGRMAAESGFTRDVLLNEAMKAFARSRGYAVEPRRKPAASEDAAFPGEITPVRPGPPPPPPPEPTPQLFLFFNGQRYAIPSNTDFVIGRGSAGCHLTIKDVNVSRRHAAIAFRNGHYYLQDLGSLNGIEYRGEQIDHKRIEEGDVFHICDYELRFSFQAK